MQGFQAEWWSRLHLDRFVKLQSVIQMQPLFSHRSERWTTAHSHSYTHSQVDSMAQQMLNSPTQIYPHFIDSIGYCVGGQWENKKDSVYKSKEKRD